MEKKNFLMYLKGGLMILMLSLVLASCDEKDNVDKDEPNTNPKNIIGRWQKYQVEYEDKTWGSEISTSFGFLSQMGPMKMKTAVR